jgi:hypothetical protein
MLVSLHEVLLPVEREKVFAVEEYYYQYLFLSVLIDIPEQVIELMFVLVLQMLVVQMLVL